ncbi:MAG: LLM class F420-dependent oxidoreductase [Acidimicrobiales bacterium]
MKISAAISFPFEPSQATRRARDLEAAGIDMIWVPEAYTFDAVSLLGYLAAHTERVELATGILPLFSRTPSLIAMSAAGLDSVSGGRFVLGLGTSGPQVIEGWHGVPFDRPLTRTRETIDICRILWRREQVVYDGEAYRLPLPPDEGTGLGKPLRLINRPLREEIPIYLASIGPKNVQLTAELADGWLPAFFHPDRAGDVFGPDLEIGGNRRDPSRAPLEVVAGGPLAICDSETAERIRDMARPATALYVGGMGARSKNFYNDIFRRCGYEREAQEIQDLYLAGHKDEAAAAVPTGYLEATALVGDEGFVRERVLAYKAAGVTRLHVDPMGDDWPGLIELVRSWVD